MIEIGEPELPNYIRIANELKAHIVNNALKPGQRFASHEALSRRFGVSRVTIRQSLQLLEKSGHVKMLPKKGTFVSDQISSILNVRHHLVALVIEDFQDPFFNEMTHFFQKELRLANLHVVLADTLGTGPETRHVDLLKNLVDGFIVGPSLRESSWAEYRALAATGVPYVLFDRDIRSIPGDRVLVDSYLGGRIAADHLADLGHASFASITYTWPSRAHKIPSDSLVLRVRGFRDRLAERGFPESSILSLVGEGGRTKDAGIDAGIQWVSMRPRPTALFATNDILCVGTIEIAEKNGLRMPKDFSIVGFDDMNLIRWLNIPLTTIAQPKEAIARCAVRLLLNQMERGNDGRARHELLMPELRVRNSTAPPAQGT